MMSSECLCILLLLLLVVILRPFPFFPSQTARLVSSRLVSISLILSIFHTFPTTNPLVPGFSNKTSPTLFPFPFLLSLARPFTLLYNPKPTHARAPR